MSVLDDDSSVSKNCPRSGSTTSSSSQSFFKLSSWILTTAIMFILKTSHVERAAVVSSFSTTSSYYSASSRQVNSRLAATGPTAGSFFNPVPPDDDKDTSKKQNKNASPPRPSSQLFQPPGNQKPFIGVGPPLNDPTKPEYDDQGYTLYRDERTGEQSRVFEALVNYPCRFTMKIVGEDKANFVTEIISIVASSCEVETHQISHTTRVNGKWTSITVQAPVQNAQMLYGLYENIDKHPRVRFKF